EALPLAPPRSPRLPYHRPAGGQLPLPARDGIRRQRDRRKTDGQPLADQKRISAALWGACPAPEIRLPPIPDRIQPLEHRHAPGRPASIIPPDDAQRMTAISHVPRAEKTSKTALFGALSE